jgi:hypothetical protein
LAPHVGHSNSLCRAISAVYSGDLSMTGRQEQALEAVRAAAHEAKAAGQLAGFFGALESLRVEVLMASSNGSRPGRVFTVEEAAARLGRSMSWVYKNKATLPIVRFPTGGFGFDEKRLERWIERRSQ